MNKKAMSLEQREAIVAEYLLGGTSYRKLEAKHGIDFRIIHSWVMKFQGRIQKKTKVEKASACEAAVGAIASTEELQALKEELRKEKLRNQLLNAIIDIAEQDLKISIRKKSGTKQ